MTAVAQAGPVTPDRLRTLFAPRSVALVGATERSGWAGNVHDNLVELGFTGPVVPVHPRREPFRGRPAVAGLAELAEPVDLAFVLTGADRAEAALVDAAAAGVRSAVVLAAGYRETGAAGAAREAALLRRAAELDVVLLGPNGIGFVNAGTGTAPFGLRLTPPVRAGGVGVVLQSGALAHTVVEFARAQGVGLSLLVSMGNEAMVRAADVVEHLVDDPATRVIALFLEGIRDAPRFLRLARRAATAGKPVVVLKVGRSPGVQRSALAHTGAVVGDDAVVDAALRQAGAVRVRSLEELVATAGLLAAARPPAGRRMGVVTDSGGANDLVSDGAHDRGIAVPELAPATAAALAGVVPAFGSAVNPVDVTGLGLASRNAGEPLIIDRALDVVSRDPGVDFVLYMGVVLADRAPSDAEHAATVTRLRAVRELMDAAPVPVVTVGYTETDLGPYGRRVLEETGLHMVRGIDLAMAAIGHAVAWDEQRHGPGSWEPAELPPGPDGPPRAWSEAAARALLAQAGVPLVDGGRAGSAAEAAAVAARLGGPVAVKVCSADVPHKSEIGGVELGVAPRDAAAAYERVRARGEAVAPVEGVLVTRMRPGGLELVVGVTRDPTFGPVLAVGLGGIWVEALRDTALRVLPVDRAEVLRMLGELRGRALLHGARGREPADLDRVADAVLRIAAAALSLGPALDTVEVNPLRVAGAEVEALDALVVTRGPA